jgi:PTH1 family peptidyl-tRNA hydrolase
MKLIVGLGNPGPEYAITPHNAGFMAIDRIAQVCDVAVNNFRGRAMTGKARLAGHEVLLAKPATFMNLSGLSVAALVDELGLGVEDVIVLYDELDFPLGRLQIKERGSANGHNGVKSISAELGTEEWTRVRIGVGKPALPDGPEGQRLVRSSGGKDYLLAPMRKQELAVMDEVLDLAVRAVEAVLTKGVSAAMNEFNKKQTVDSSE